MLLVDSNIFIYARGNHANSPDSRAMVESAVAHPEWCVPLLVLLEVTHYYRDNGEYAALIGAAFTTVETLLCDFEWAFEHSSRHAELNDLVILATARRLEAKSVISYDDFFERQKHINGIDRVLPAGILS